MSYYVVDVAGRCQGPTGRGCGARAGHEVRGPGNARMGSYCSKCSKIRVRDLDRAEREAQRARLATREVTRPHAAPPSERIRASDTRPETFHTDADAGL